MYNISPKFLNKLPIDIKNLIYDDHFKYFIKTNELNEVLRCKESYQLCTSKLLPYVNNILKDENYIRYLNNNNYIFKLIYKEHFIENKECFVKLPRNKSMALSWLMYLYH